MRKRFVLVLKNGCYALNEERGGMHAVFKSLKEAIEYATKAAAGQPAELVVTDEHGKATLELAL